MTASELPMGARVRLVRYAREFDATHFSQIGQLHRERHMPGLVGRTLFVVSVSEPWGPYGVSYYLAGDPRLVEAADVRARDDVFLVEPEEVELVSLGPDSRGAVGTEFARFRRPHVGEVVLYGDPGYGRREREEDTAAWGALGVPPDAGYLAAVVVGVHPPGDVVDLSVLTRTDEAASPLVGRLFEEVLFGTGQGSWCRWIDLAPEPC